MCEVTLCTTICGERTVDYDRTSPDMKRASRERARLQCIQYLKFAKAGEFVCSPNLCPRVGRQCYRIETSRGPCAHFGANLFG